MTNPAPPTTGNAPTASARRGRGGVRAHALDDVDRRILALLQQDASRSNQALAHAAEVSPATAWRRVRALRASGAIRREMALLDPAVAGGLQAIVELSLERPEALALGTLQARLVADPRVQQCWRLGGQPDLLLVLWVASMDDYAALARDLLAPDPDIRNVRTYFATACLKFDPSVPVAAPAGFNRA